MKNSILVGVTCLMVLCLLSIGNVAFATELTNITLDPENATGSTTNAPGAWTTNTGDPLGQVGVTQDGVFLNSPGSGFTLGEISIDLHPGINTFDLYGNGTFPGNTYYGAVLFFDGVATPPQVAVYNSNGGTDNFLIQDAGNQIMGGANGGLFFDEAPGTDRFIAPDGSTIQVLEFFIDSNSSDSDLVSTYNIGADGTYDTVAHLSLLVTVPGVSDTFPMRVNVASDGSEANGDSRGAPSISADGRYTAFSSDAPNLVSGDTNGIYDVFIHDVQTGETARVSIASDGSEANDVSKLPTLSADGRYVAFVSSASNLVSGDTNGLSDVFVRDRDTGLTTRVSVASDGSEGNASSISTYLNDRVSVSADGRYVVFSSNASNLVEGDTNGVVDVFIHDRTNGQTTRMSVASDGGEAQGPSWGPSMSADGRYVSFTSHASNIVSGDTNGFDDTFVYDRSSGQVIRVSIASDGSEGNNASNGTSAISDDGTIIAFESYASNFASGDEDYSWDVFVHDRASGETIRLARNDFFGFPIDPSISADGRFVAFSRYESSGYQVVVYDRVTGQTNPLALFSDATEPNDLSWGRPAISADGRFVVFTSSASNLVDGDTNGAIDVFVAKPANHPPIIELVGDNPLVVIQGSVFVDPGATATDTEDGDISSSIQVEGVVDTASIGTTSLIYTVTDSQGLDATPVTREVLVVEAPAEVFPVRVSLTEDGGESTGAFLYPALSADARFVAFNSTDSHLVPGSPLTGTWGTFIHDRLTKQTMFISGDSEGPSSLSADGRYVAFTSDASDHVSGDTNRSADVFLYDRTSHQTTRVNVASDGSEAQGQSTGQSMSADGRFIAFVSGAENLVSGDTNGFDDVFVRDRDTGLTTRVSVASDGSEGNAPASSGFTSKSTSISADGRYVAFTSRASNLVADDSNSVSDVFVHDRNTGETTRASLASDGTMANDSSHGPRISADGQVVTFASLASNLTEYDQNNEQDIFVRDRIHDQMNRVSAASNGTAANDRSEDVISISDDGQFIAFSSVATTLAPGDTNAKEDIFLYDRIRQLTTRVNMAQDGSQANDRSTVPVVSPDGQYIAYASLANNLAPGDDHDAWDIYVTQNPGVFTLKVEKSVSGSGSVNINPPGDDCGDMCSSYPGGDPVTVTLTATPADNSLFTGWGGDNCSGTGTCTITISEDTTVTALFEYKVYSLSGRVTNDQGQPIEGVEIHYRKDRLWDFTNPGELGAVTDTNGQYSMTDLSPRHYALTPIKQGYAFEPVGGVFEVRPDVTDADFNGGVTHTITGRITTCDDNPVVGVEIIALAATHFVSDVTNDDGYYNIQVRDGTYEVKPQGGAWGSKFLPRVQPITVSAADITGINFRMGTGANSVSDKVTYRDYVEGIPGVTLTTNCGQTATTESDGTYHLELLGEDTTIVASKEGHTFVPSSLPLPNSFFVGYDRQPIVMVHGWNSYPAQTFKLHGNNVPKALENARYHVEFAYLETSMDYTPSLESNAPRVAEAVEKALKATGQEKAIVVAHSMGGLVSRVYIEGPDYRGDVSELFTFGSPHLGVQPSIVDLVIRNGTGGPAVKQMAHDMRYFNERYGRRPDIIYHATAGSAPEGLGTDPKARNGFGQIAGGLIFGPDDAFVPTGSARGLAGTVDRLTTDELHATTFGEYTYFNRSSDLSRSYYECLKGVLVDMSKNACGAFSTKGMTVTAASVQTTLESSAPNQHSVIKNGVIYAGEQMAHPVDIEGGPTKFVAHWFESGTVDVSLNDPEGNRITPESAELNPESITYDSDGTTTIYTLTDAIPGQWNILVEGGEDIEEQGNSIKTLATFESTLGVTATFDQQHYSPGDTAVLRVVFTEPTQSATVNAELQYADGTVTTVHLAEQSDGSYEGSTEALSSPGTATAVVVATGVTQDNVVFERSEYVGFQVSSSAVSLAGIYTDTPEPQEDDASLYKALTVSVGVEAVNDTRVMVSADLADADGALLVHAVQSEDVTSGDNTIMLTFDAKDIFATQYDGPFTLTNIFVSELSDETLVADEAVNVYTTQSYNYRDFAPRREFPVVDLGGPRTVDEGSTVTLTASASDPENDPLRYEWEIDGEGQLESTNQTAVLSAQELSGPGQRPTIVTVRVTDSHDLSAVASTSVDILNVVPVLQDIPDAEIDLDQSFVYDGSFIDPGADTWSAVVEYGDGTGVQSLEMVDKTFTLEHLYSEAGAYEVTVTVSDDDGGESKDLFTVTVGTPIIDLDNDGVSGDVDACLNSNLSPTVVIGTCDSGVGNPVDLEGCTISDQVSTCEVKFRNKNRFVMCVSKVTKELKKEGTISRKERRSIRRCSIKHVLNR